MLVKTLGVKRLVVVINKMDDSSVEWSKERYDEIVEKLAAYLRGQLGFKDSDLEFIPISGLKGYNIKEAIPVSKCSWYNGPTLLGYLDEMPSIERRLDAAFLMPVSGKYKDMGTIVTGKIESGAVFKGQQVLMMPNRQTAEVLAIYIEEMEMKTARSGDNVRLRLRGVEEEEVSTGFVVCDPQHPVRTTNCFQAQLFVREIKNIIAPGYKAVLHIHTCSEEVTIASLDNFIDKKTGAKLPKKPLFARQNDIVIATIESTGTICLESAKDCEPLGRFSLRDEGKTIAVGRVIDANPAVFELQS